jgi:hypothetical protein
VLRTALKTWRTTTAIAVTFAAFVAGFAALVGNMDKVQQVVRGWLGARPVEISIRDVNGLQAVRNLPGTWGYDAELGPVSVFYVALVFDKKGEGSIANCVSEVEFEGHFIQSNADPFDITESRSVQRRLVTRFAVLEREYFYDRPAKFRMVCDDSISNSEPIKLIAPMDP